LTRGEWGREVPVTFSWKVDEGLGEIRPVHSMAGRPFGLAEVESRYFVGER